MWKVVALILAGTAVFLTTSVTGARDEKKPLTKAQVYVDLAPDARFAHGTQCILISTDGARVIEGNWWLILNGKPLFRDGKASQVDFPISLSGK